MASTSSPFPATATSDDAAVKPTPLATHVKLTGFVKPKKSRWSTVSMLSLMAIAIFAADLLLLGWNNEPGSRWFGIEVMQAWASVRSSTHGTLDVACGVFILAAIALKLLSSHSPFAPRKGSHKQGAVQGRAVASKSSRQGVERNHEERTSSAGSGAAAARTVLHRPENFGVRNAASGSNAAVTRWNQAIDAAARQGDSEKASRLLEEFDQLAQDEGQEGNRPDSVSYNLVIRAFAKKCDVKGAEAWLLRMEKSGLEATLCSYNTVLDACAKANDAEACDAWLGKLISSGCGANVISYATAIYAWARRGEEGAAAAWLQKMKEAGIEPDAVSYNSMIHACGVAGNPAGAQHWVLEMQARGLEATVTTFTAVIDACAKANDVPGAEKMLEAMIESKVQPNVVTFSAMIDACAKSCNLSKAEYWHERMIECNVKPNAHSFSAVINACAKVGDVDKAEEWLGRSEVAGIVTDVVVYSSVIDACGKAGDAERAMVVFQRMQAHGIQPHIVAYAALARPFAYKGDFVEVERISGEMIARRIKPNEYFLYAHLLSYATCRPQQPQRAEECYRRAVKLGVKTNDHVATVLVRAVGRERCAELFQELCNGRSVPSPAGGRTLNRKDGKTKPLPTKQHHS